MSQESSVSFPKVEQFVAACNKAMERYILSATAVLNCMSYIIVDSSRIPLDQAFMREVEPDNLLAGARVRYCSEVLFTWSFAFESGIAQDYHLVKGMRCESYVLRNYSDEQRNALKDELLEARARDHYPNVLVGLEEVERELRNDKLEATTDNTTNNSTSS